MLISNVYAAFDMLCLAVMLTIMVRFIIMKKRVPFQGLYFIMIVLCQTLVVSDLVYELYSANNIHLPRFMQYLVNDVYFFSAIFIIPVWATYSIRLSKISQKAQKAHLIFTFIPPAVVFAMTLLSYWTKWIYYIDNEGVYHRGALNIITLILPILYLIFCIVFTVIRYSIHKDSVSRRNFFAVLSFVFFPITAVILSMFIADVPIISIGETLGMLQTFITVIMRDNEIILIEEQEKEKRMLEQAMLCTVREYSTVASLSLTEEDIKFVYPSMAANEHLSFSEFSKLIKSTEIKSDDFSSSEDFADFMKPELIRERLQNDQKLNYNYALRKDIYSMVRANDAAWNKNCVKEFVKVIEECNALAATGDSPDSTHVIPMVISITEVEQNEKSLSSAILTVRSVRTVIEKEKQQQEKIAEALRTAEAAGRAKSEFLARMSHEIRTPINAILGMNTMIERESKDEQILEYSANIESAGSMLLTLINDILDMSKIESGKMEIVPVEYRLSRLITDLKNMVMTRIQNKDIAFQTDIDETTPEYLYGDAIRIKQILTNLLTNAAKYTDKGTITLSVKYMPEKENELMLSFRITDTGRGIQEKDLAGIFEAFKRADMMTNRNIEGTGLGLSITKSFVDMMNGSLNVTSKYGQGSVFSVTLPQKIMKNVPIGDFQKATKDDVKTTAKTYQASFTAPDAHILVVDDNKMNLMVMSKLLGRTKVIVDQADGGYACIDRLKNARYDLVLLDHMMPAPDGIATLKIIKEQKLAEGTPIVALTANVMAGAKEQYTGYGFDAYLPKPVVAADLERLMAELLPADKVKKADN